MKNTCIRFLILSGCLSCPMVVFSQNVGIGNTTPSGKLHIKGSANVSQLIIDAHSTQSDTSPLIRLRSSVGEDLLWIHSNNIQNTFVGYKAGRVNDTGTGIVNTFLGTFAGNSNTNGSTNTAIGNSSFLNNINGSDNVALGFQALYTNVAGSGATAIGVKAMQNSDRNSTAFSSYNVAVGYAALRGIDLPPIFFITGNYNVAIGYTSMYSNWTGQNNTACGYRSLYYNLGGNNNTALGNYALQSNVEGNYNSGSGFNCMASNTKGNYNTAFGMNALYYNDAGSNATAIGTSAMQNANNTTTPFTNFNVAVGYEALKGSMLPSSNTGNYNTAIGYQTLLNNTSGDFNTALGLNALLTNSSGASNLAVGRDALYFNSSGNYNTACGERALLNITTAVRNTAIGRNAGSTYVNGNWCTFLGAYADASTSSWANSAAMGDGAIFTGSNYIRIGDGSVGTIGGAVIWSVLSDGRFKRDVQEDVKGMEFISKLRPVTYHMDVDGYNRHTYGEGYEQSEMKKKYDQMKSMGLMENEVTTFSGFIAQEVEQAAKATGYNFDGVVLPKNDRDAYSLRYAEFVVPLVKAVQELNAKLENMQSENEKLIDRIERLEELLEQKK